MTIGGSVWPGALDVLARHAARCLEAITAVKTAQIMTGQTHDGNRVVHGQRRRCRCPHALDPGSRPF